MSGELNPPAFPRPASTDSSEDDIWEQDGMSLRDYFIAHAPPPPDWFAPHQSNNKYDEDKFFQWPRVWADEMLKQRVK